MLFAKYLEAAGTWMLGGIEDPDLELVIVMVFIPLVMNMINVIIYIYIYISFGLWIITLKINYLIRN